MKAKPEPLFPFRTVLLVLAACALAFMLAGCATSAQTAALGAASLAGAIAALEEALRSGSIDPNLGGSLLAALKFLEAQGSAQGQQVADALAAVQALGANLEKVTPVVENAAAVQDQLGTIKDVGLVTAGGVGLYGTRKAWIPLVSMILRGITAAAAGARRA